MKPSYLYTGDEIVLVIDSVPYTVDRTHPNFEAILESVKVGQFDQIPNLASLAGAIKEFGKGKITVDEDESLVLFNGEAIHNTLTDRILRMIGEGFSVEPLAKFLENLMSNPSKRAIDELYTFLEYGKLPITEDGCFLAYKRVRDNFRDVYTGKIDNSIGQVVQMERNKVDDRSHQTCSTGLHFCSLEYLKSFSGDHVMILKINPADVVSIPVDYNNTKGRCCKYEVVGEYKGAMTDPAFTGSVAEWSGDSEVDLDMDDGYDTSRDLDTVTVTDHVEGYRTGYKDGHARDEAEVVQSDLEYGGTFEDSEYGQGYVDGYKDGRGHKAKKH